MRNFNENMIELGDQYYRLDIDVFSDLLSSGQGERTIDTETENRYVPVEGASTNVALIETVVHSREYEKAVQIDGPKYDLLRMSLEVLLTYAEDTDDTLGADRVLSGTTIPFKIAFNTLLHYGVLVPIVM
jgi:hypothetical protein